MNKPPPASRPAAADPPFKSLNRLLSRRVLLLSLIGIVGLASTIALCFFLTLHQVQSRMDGINLEAGGVFDRFFLDIQSDLKTSGEGLASRTDQPAALLALRTRNRAFLDVLLVNTNGVVLAQRNAVGRPQRTQIDSPAWLVAPPPFGQVVTGPVRFEGETPCVEMAAVVTDDLSLPVGLLVVRVDLTALWNATLDIKVGETGYACITDSTGQLVAFRNRRLLETGSNLQRLVGRTPLAIVASRLNFYTGLNGKWDLASAQPLKTVPWFAVVEQPASEALAPFQIPALVLLTSLVLVAVLLFSTIRFLRRRIVSPLVALRDVVGAMADGKMQQSLPVRNNDELGQLSGSFNRLAAHLRQAFVDLENQIAALQQAQSTLRASEARQSAMIANIADVIAIVDQHGINKFKSPNLEKWFGWKPEDLVGVSAWENIHPEDRQLVLYGLASILGKPNAMQSGECRYRCKDGGYKWIELSASNLLHDPNVGGILLNYHDITERKRTAVDLAELQRRQERILTAVGEGLHGIGRDGNIIFENPAAAAMLGWEVNELIGRPAHAVMHHTRTDGSPYPKEECHIHATMRDGVVRRVEDELFWRKDGTSFHVTYTCTPMRNEAGEIIGAVVAFRDITERKRVEESHARLATVVEQASEIIVITNPQGKILYVNPSFEKITGYTKVEAVGQNPRLLKSGRHDDAFYRRLWEVLKSGEVWSGHFINHRKDGALYEVEATISPVRDAVGNVINYVAVQRDVTREVQLEAELRQSQKMEAVGQLAGGVAHDFNNILSALMMQTELVNAVESLPAEAREGLGQISADARRAADLTRQLLLFSRRQVMHTRILDLNEVVMNLAKMLQRIIREDLKLELSLHATPLMTRADAGMLDQVLMNLAVNARDAMSAGGRLRVETSQVFVGQDAALSNPDANPGDYVCLSVSDTGTGIPPEILPRIFEPFFTTKEAGQGTGLGLATVFGIVKQHQGWIKIDNRPGQGVTFSVFLPMCALPAVEPVASAARPKLTGGTETILMVEDEVAVLKPTRKFLERHGYTVLTAANGMEALKCWETNRDRIALLLTDLVMPGALSGQTLARQLRAEAPRLKVIFISGYSADIAGKEFELQEGEAFIQKPCATDHLLEIIRRTLDA